jgi:uridine kinase
VAVDGPSGSGKSYFAAKMRDEFLELGIQAPIVQTDDLLDGWEDQLTFWPRLEEFVLAPVREGREGGYRPYDWHLGRRGNGWVRVPPAPVLVLEGVSTARAEVRPELTLAIFVVAPREIRESRVLLRDGHHIQPFMSRWRAVEAEFFLLDKTLSASDVVVDGAPIDVPHDPRVEFVAFQIDPGGAPNLQMSAA